MKMIEVKTSDLVGAALDWAHLTAMHGGGPDWNVVDGLFGIVYLKNVRVGMDGISEVEHFQEYNPGDLYGVIECRAIVAAKLGDTVSVPAELL